ncbi:hypothetical protein ACPWT1_20520 [Ramlibacter sp. MMS24-I3-19]|uniref:hypothetical protein n=1 Tax=Ramlibacter sp. MMS24-I3-19 TaxID=3416606 RepID=UPI003D06B8E9
MEGFVTQEEAHLVRRLRALLAERDRHAKAGRRGVPASSETHENRRMVHDCINKLRLARAGVPSAFIGFGQREARRSG